IVNGDFQHFAAIDDVVIHKNIDVRSDMALLSQDTIAQPRIFIPTPIQRFTDVLWRTFDPNFRASAGELCQVACDLKGNHRRELSSAWPALSVYTVLSTGFYLSCLLRVQN